MNRKAKFIVALLLVVVASIYYFFNTTSRESVAKEFLNNNYSTSTIGLKEDFEEMNVQFSKLYSKYFTQRGFGMAIANRYLAIGDILKLRGQILESNCESIKLRRTNNKCEYAYSIVLHTKLPSSEIVLINYKGILRFSDNDGKLIDAFFPQKINYDF